MEDKSGWYRCKKALLNDGDVVLVPDKYYYLEQNRLTVRRLDYRYHGYTYGFFIKKIPLPSNYLYNYFCTLQEERQAKIQASLS
jgi:hypothetical protein